MESETLSRFPSASVDKYNPITSKSQFRTSKLFVMGREENNKGCFPINILNVQREKKSI